MSAELGEAIRQQCSVRRGGPGEVGAMALTLARAFEDDPHAAYVMRDSRRRLERLRNAFALWLRSQWLRHDECYTTGNAVGAAIWVPPARLHAPPLVRARGLLELAWVYRRDTPRGLRALRHVESMHPESPDHFYLVFLGVDPRWQGRGIGTAMLVPVLARCDAEGIPAYLEASTQRNRAVYERNGFEVVEEYRLGGDGPPGWRMWREPGGGA